MKMGIISKAINKLIEAAVKAKADELSKKYYRNTTVNSVLRLTS